MKSLKVLYLSLLIIILDQLTKLAVKGFEIPSLGLKVKGMMLGESKPVLGDFLRITYTENPGMAFGINFGDKFYLTLLTFIAALIVFIYLIKARNESIMLRFSLAMIFGGAIGNLIDRVFYGVIFNYGKLFYGRVVDFIDFDFFNFKILGYHVDRFPIFNIADASVTIGVILLLFSQGVERKGETEINPETVVSDADCEREDKDVEKRENLEGN